MHSYFFGHMQEVREEKERKAQAIKSAKKQACELVKRAEGADYAAASSPIVAKPKLVKGEGERVM